MKQSKFGILALQIKRLIASRREIEGMRVLRVNLRDEDWWVESVPQGN
jgi:hypothetical protein